MKCSFLDYIQLLITSDNQLSNPSDDSCLKYEKIATKLSKNVTNEIFSVAFYRFPDGKLELGLPGNFGFSYLNSSPPGSPAHL